MTLLAALSVAPAVRAAPAAWCTADTVTVVPSFGYVNSSILFTFVLHNNAEPLTVWSFNVTYSWDPAIHPLLTSPRYLNYPSTTVFTGYERLPASPGTRTISFAIYGYNGTFSTCAIGPVPFAVYRHLSTTATANVTSGSMPLAVTFTGTGLGGASPYSYEWIFGDTGSDFGSATKHTYTSPGTFLAQLVVTDQVSEQTVAVVRITVTPSTPSLTASASPTAGAIPLQVSFTSAATGGLAPYNYSWSFGDGYTSWAENPTHAYSAPGTYTAVVSLTDAAGQSVTKTVTVTVQGPPDLLPGLLVGGIAAAAVAVLAIGWLVRRRAIPEGGETASRRFIHGRRLWIILGVVVLAAVLIGVSWMTWLNPANQPYRAEITVDSYGGWSTYRGQTPLHPFFLVTEVTVRNTGPAMIVPQAGDWHTADATGALLDPADPQFYTALSIAPGASADLVLVFDSSYGGPPPKLVLTLPNGADVVAEPSPAQFFGASMTLRSVTDVDTYQGRTLAQGYFMVVNMTMTNTGTFALFPGGYRWYLSDSLGTLVAYATSSSVPYPSVDPGRSVDMTVAFVGLTATPVYVVFDMYADELSRVPIGAVPVPYAAVLSVVGNYSTASYQGTAPGSGFFEVVNVTLSNEGLITIAPASQDWLLFDTFGGTMATSLYQFYSAVIVPPGERANLTLVFQCPPGGVPAALALVLSYSSRFTISF